MFQTLPLKVSTFDGRNFVLLEGFSFTRSTGEVISVPAGTESDGASTPASLWVAGVPPFVICGLPPFGKYWPAAFLHDWAYRRSSLDKDACDGLLAEAMTSLGVPELERIAIYEGVRFGGALAFKQDRELQNAA